MEAFIRAGVVGREAQVKVSGRATYASGASLRNFMERARERGVQRILVDVGECLSMDSTFMGVLTLAALNGRQGGVSVEIGCANGKVRGQMVGLGIAPLFAFSEATAEAGTLSPLQKAARETAGAEDALSQTVLAAHETLGRAHPDNVERFKDVVDALKTERSSAGS